MSGFILPQFASMRGFGMSGVPNGFCGGIATLGVNTHRPSVQNAGYRLSPSGAAQLYRYARTHTFTDPDEGVRLICDPNGAMRIYGVHALLSGIASGQHRCVGYAGSPGGFSYDGWLADLRATVTRKTGMIVEWANGLAFGGDETNLHYHFTGIGGEDSTHPDVTGEYAGSYATCDDDWSSNAWPARANPPVWRAKPTMDLAQPIAYVVCAA